MLPGPRPVAKQQKRTAHRQAQPEIEPDSEQSQGNRDTTRGPECTEEDGGQAITDHQRKGIQKLDPKRSRRALALAHPVACTFESRPALEIHQRMSKLQLNTTIPSPH